MLLGSVADTRDNNFQCIRIIGALSVLISHCFVLSSGNPDSEPLRSSLGMTPGTIAVDIFFMTSGFLVTASMMRTRSALDFSIARFLRIYPALLFMVTFTVFGIGLLNTTWHWSNYFEARQTYFYFLKCITLFTGITYQLPGVFESNPYAAAVNGSLWTMPQEIRVYAALLMAWAMSSLARNRREATFQYLVLLMTVLAGAAVLYFHFSGTDDHKLLWLFFVFFSGASFYFLRNKIELSPFLFSIAAAIVVATIVERQLFFVAYMFCFGYLLFFLAYVPGGLIRRYNAAGDYSYGVYIYAFPIQQAFVAAMPGISTCTLLLLSVPSTLLLAILSWHLIEKSSLAKKGYWIAWIRQRCAHRIKSLR